MLSENWVITFQKQEFLNISQVGKIRLLRRYKMEKPKQWVAVFSLVLVLVGLPFLGDQAKAAGKPIVIGAPLATAFLYGWDAERAMKLAAEEINAEGGVTVGKEKRPLKIEAMDPETLSLECPSAMPLLVVEKLLLEKNADSIVGGPVRSEGALAAMDLLSKYKKVSILTTGALSPASRNGWKPNMINSNIVLEFRVKWAGWWQENLFPV